MRRSLAIVGIIMFFTENHKQTNKDDDDEN